MQDLCKYGEQQQIYGVGLYIFRFAESNESNQLSIRINNFLFSMNKMRLPEMEYFMQIKLKSLLRLMQTFVYNKGFNIQQM